jgi:hypothetical protein
LCGDGVCLALAVWWARARVWPSSVVPAFSTDKVEYVFDDFVLTVDWCDNSCIAKLSRRFKIVAIELNSFLERSPPLFVSFYAFDDKSHIL